MTVPQDLGSYVWLQVNANSPCGPYLALLWLLCHFLSLHWPRVNICVLLKVPKVQASKGKLNIKEQRGLDKAVTFISEAHHTTLKMWFIIFRML